MIDHIGIAVSDLKRSIAFYTKALAPLGYTLIMQFETGRRVRRRRQARLLDRQGRKGPKDASTSRSARRAAPQVRAFYEAAMAAGGTDNGAPGVRPHYHEHYYGAFVLDPDGHNIEAVCHEPFLD